VKAPVTPVKLPDRPWGKVVVDLVGPLSKKAGGKEFVLTLIDSYSRWPEIWFLNSISSEAVMRALDQVFAREGFPEVLLSDNGRQFVSHEFEEYLRVRGIVHETTALYSPESAGLIERWNGTLKTHLDIALEKGENWEESVETFLMQYRLTPHPSTGLSPSYLLKGRVCRGWVNQGDKGQLLMGEEKPQINQEWRERVVANLASTYVRVNRGRRRTPKNFRSGDLVWVRRPGSRGTSKGVILDCVSPFTYRLMDGSKWNVQRLARRKETNDTMAVTREQNVREESEENSRVEMDLTEEEEPRYPVRVRREPNRWLGGRRIVGMVKEEERREDVVFWPRRTLRACGGQRSSPSARQAATNARL